MNAEIFIQKDGNICCVYAMYDNDMIALSDEFDYSWETLRTEVTKMIKFVKRMGFSVDSTLP